MTVKLTGAELISHLESRGGWIPDKTIRAGYFVLNDGGIIEPDFASYFHAVRLAQEMKS